MVFLHCIRIIANIILIIKILEQNFNGMGICIFKLPQTLFCKKIVIDFSFKEGNAQLKDFISIFLGTITQF